MNEIGFAFDDSIPLHRFQGAEIQAFLVGSMTLTLELTEDRRIHLDYLGSVEDRDAWINRLPLSGETSLMSLVGQTIAVEFLSADRALIRLSGGGTIDLARDAPGADLVRFCIGSDEFEA